MKCRYFCRLPLDISPVYLTRGISIRACGGYFFYLLIWTFPLIISQGDNIMNDEILRKECKLLRALCNITYKQ